MANRTYNTGRVVGWSTYEEFLKETGVSPSDLSSYMYNTLVTYGVTRVVDLSTDAWTTTNGGKFYTQTVEVSGASWGAVPIVGVSYEAYLDVISSPTTTDEAAEVLDIADKEAIEEAVGNIFAVYVSDAQGNKTTNALADHGYLTFMAYPDVLAFQDSVRTIDGEVLRLIVRGLSMENLDVSTLYYGPQGFIFAGNGLSGGCALETRNINNLAVNSGGYLWLSMGGNPTPADYRGLIDHPAGEILTSTFGYLDLDFLNGTGDFTELGSYGFTYAEYQDAFSGINKITTQVDAIPAPERDNYVYLVAGADSYTEYPPAASPLYIIPVRKENGRVNVGSYASFSKPVTKKPIDFTRTYADNGDDGTVLYIYDKKLPDYLGNWWGGATPTSDGLTYLGNNTLTGHWIYDDLTAASYSVYHSSGRTASWKLDDDRFHKGYTYVLSNQTDSSRNGVYLCTQDSVHDAVDYSQLNRMGGYVPITIPQWVLEKSGTFAFELDLTGTAYSIQAGVLYIGGTPVYPGEILLLGNSNVFKMVYVWNTITSGAVQLILDTNLKPLFYIDANYSQNITDDSDIHSRIFHIPRSDWDVMSAGRSLTVWSNATTSYPFLTVSTDLTPGCFLLIQHENIYIWGADKQYSYVLLSQDSNELVVASAMVWVDNPTLTATVGYPGTYNAVVPRYNQSLPNHDGSYYYNMKTVLSRTPARRMFEDFGWDISDYVSEDFQRISLGEFLQDCVTRSDLTVAKTPETNRAYGITSTFRLYSKEDFGYTSGQIPAPNPEIQSSLLLSAKTSPESFFATAYYSFTTRSGDAVDINNKEYPIWESICKSKSGKRVESVSLIDALGNQLSLAGNEGDIEADKVNWLDLLTALGSGKSVDLLHGMKVRKDEQDHTYLVMADGTRLYVCSEEPTGDIPEGSIGIGF